MCCVICRVASSASLYPYNPITPTPPIPPKTLAAAQGARRLYQDFLRPFLLQHQRQVDHFLQQLSGTTVSPRNASNLYLIHYSLMSQ